MTLNVVSFKDVYNECIFLLKQSIFKIFSYIFRGNFFSFFFFIVFYINVISFSFMQFLSCCQCKIAFYLYYWYTTPYASIYCPQISLSLLRFLFKQKKNKKKKCERQNGQQQKSSCPLIDRQTNTPEYHIMPSSMVYKKLLHTP